MVIHHLAFEKAIMAFGKLVDISWQSLLGRLNIQFAKLNKQWLGKKKMSGEQLSLLHLSIICETDLKQGQA